MSMTPDEDFENAKAICSNLGLPEPRREPLSAEEMAERLYQKLLEPKTSLDYSDPTILIAKVLTEYAEARVKEELTKVLTITPEEADQMVLEEQTEIRNDILEEAAKVAQSQECSLARFSETCQCDVEISDAIRALKSTPEVEK